MSSADLYFSEFLSRFGGRGVLRCSCGAEHRVAVRKVLFGEDVLGESADLLRREHGVRPTIWVLSDEKTEATAGARWKSGVSADRIASRVLRGDPRPVPTIELVNELASEVKDISPELLVSVGGGVISDLVKKISLDTGIPNWCVVTSPSVDAYTSATSSIRVAGYPRALPARVSEVIVCDLGVIGRAPPILFLSGLGDLLAKLIASFDWNLARIVAGEPHCDTIGAYALGAARRALGAAQEWRVHPARATSALTDAILVSGLAMQSFGSSRPAASAEHTIAHFWEMAEAVGDDSRDLHGILVGAASRLILPGYAAFSRRLRQARPDPVARLAEREREPPWEEVLEEGMRPFAWRIAEEMRGRDLRPSELSRRLAAFDAERDRILQLAEQMLDELSDAVHLLDALGFPFSLDALGIAEPWRMLPVRNVRLLRNRYTAFDLAYDLGEVEQLLGPIHAGR